MGAGLFVSHTPLAVPGLEPLGGDGLFLYRVEGALPRAFLAGAWSLDTDRLDAMAGADVSTGRVVLLEEEPAIAPAADLPPPWEARVLPGRREPDRSAWHVESPAPALFVVLEGWYPGWRAEVDGRPAPLLRANHAFRAVAVPAGEHTVEFRFEPASVRVGAAGSLLTLLLLIALLPFWATRRRRASK